MRRPVDDHEPGVRGDGAPAVRRRAPLQLAAPGPPPRRAVRVLPPFTGGLHCSNDRVEVAAGLIVRAPAFHRRAPLQLDHRRLVPAGHLVLPPFSGGLHCGYQASPVCHSTVNGAPAVQRRAPLRHVVQLDVAQDVQVLPPFNSGLHCGRTASLPVSLRLWPVFPPFSGGLHSGHSGTNRSASISVSAPAVQRRAPLRQYGHVSSRRSGTGSIAVGTRCRPGRCSSRRAPAA